MFKKHNSSHITLLQALNRTLRDQRSVKQRNDSFPPAVLPDDVILQLWKCIIPSSAFFKWCPESSPSPRGALLELQRFGMENFIVPLQRAKGKLYTRRRRRRRRRNFIPFHSNKYVLTAAKLNHFHTGNVLPFSTLTPTHSLLLPLL